MSNCPQSSDRFVEHQQPNLIAEDTIFVYEVDEFRVSEALGPNLNR